VNKEVVTIQDCLDMYEEKGNATLINDGKVIDFVTEE